VEDPALKAELLFFVGPDPMNPDKKAIYQSNQYMSFMAKAEVKELRDIFLTRHRREIRDPIVIEVMGT
jgi:hypothetical protein